MFDQGTEETPKVKADFLVRTVTRVRQEISVRRAGVSQAELVRRARDRRPPRAWAAHLAAPEEVRVIAEIKRRSPSAGLLAPGLDATVRARLYADHGAAAVSVLTDRAFDGDLSDLSAVAAAVPIPVLRKDFLVDPYQVWESRAAGADAVLLIVAAVDDVTLGELVAVAKVADLGLLVEVHSAREADRAVAAGAQVIGVNSRDLATLEVASDAGFDTLAALRSRLGPDAVLVAESGILSAEGVARARLAGADAVLVGERLMRAEDPGAALAELVQAGAGRP